jgi:tetraacyldisaccharide 4'-kinase
MTLIEGLYHIGYSIKKLHAFKHQKKLPCRVISIGNITVGGTGKTPATVAIAAEAKRRRFLPGILTRGYKGNMRGPCFVSKGHKPLLDEEEAGDEPLLMAEKLKGVPVIKGADRYEAGMFALGSLPLALCPDIFILDDGFQHWKLFRDKDVLFIDGTNPFGNKRLLPMGTLREPLEAIGRADIVVITKLVSSLQAKVGGLKEEIRKYNPKASLFLAEHRPSEFITASGETFPLEWAVGKRFLGFAGIGNPGSFKETLLTTGLDLRGFKFYRDHYRYNARDLRKIIEDSEKNDANWIVTTEKDIMRLKRLNMPANIVALANEFTVDEGFY